MNKPHAITEAQAEAFVLMDEKIRYLDSLAQIITNSDHFLEVNPTEHISNTLGLLASLADEVRRLREATYWHAPEELAPAA